METLGASFVDLPLLKQAGLKGVHLEIKSAGPSAIIESDPTGFQLAILYNMKHDMAGFERECRIVLESEINDARF